MRAFVLPLSTVAALLLTAIPAIQSAGPYGPAEGLFVDGPAQFPEDVLDIMGDCSTLEVGSAVRDVVPGVPDGEGGWDLWAEPYADTNGNGVYDAPNPLEPDAHFDDFTDTNLNGKWDGPYMAGYGHEKENNEYYMAETAHDPIWARALALRCGDVLVGMVSIDTVGLFQQQVWDIRERAADAGYDHIIVASTHTHDSIDTMGLWGPNELTDGKDPRTLDHMKARAAEALVAAAADLEPSTSVIAGGHETQDPAIVAAAGYIQTDLRDPFVVDDPVWSARFVGTDANIATLVNWSPHPETMAGTRSEISSDYPDQLRRSLETEGATVGGVHKPGIGGDAVFFSGAVGGMMTTLGARVYAEDGSLIPDYTYEKNDRIGEVAAFVAMTAMEQGQGAVVDGIRVQVREVTFPMDNVFLAALNTVGLFEHPVAIGPVTVPAPEDTIGIVPPIPFIRTELNVVTLFADGAPFIQIVTVPGELLPEIAVGGHLDNGPVATPELCYGFEPLKLAVNGGRNGNYNPETMQREPGYVRTLAANSGLPTEPVIKQYMDAPVQMLFGLANDELGYIIPAQDYTSAVPVALDGSVYTDGTDRCGDDDHYEETVSASSIMAPVVANNLVHMLDPGFEPAEWPARLGNVLGNPADIEGVLAGEPVGIWLDTSSSGGYEDTEDTHVHVALPSWVSGAWGFVDGDLHDQGQEPNEATHGLWIDLDGDEAFDKARDGVVFVDHWAMAG